ncbi:hypothetical protein K443DRAFT_251992 [Laccaria amethystina LaAM-08-1]|uniref:Uncharacterized protein n=1 Tax=Laccaria amethystina LaAM-08-1 TaxID=1095629 RepID=A0A0C9Y967_9AGAR|nr:hypothetical protein K443DRAFT_251992 [Laccaria amethystina LaAM-08-1]
MLPFYIFFIFFFVCVWSQSLAHYRCLSGSFERLSTRYTLGAFGDYSIMYTAPSE